jgi:hypothetical protein
MRLPGYDSTRSDELKFSKKYYALERMIYFSRISYEGNFSSPL